MSFYLEPKVTLSNYVSYLVGPWNRTFCDWGYPELDVVTQEDGAWGVIQYLKAPVLPAQTPWNWVITPSAKYELNAWTLKRYAEQCDIERRYVWDQMEERQKQDLAEMRKEELHMTEKQRLMYEAISRNPDLMNRIAKNGLGEMGLSKIFRNIPKHKLRKAGKNGGNASTVLHRAESSGKDYAPGMGKTADAKP